MVYIGVKFQFSLYGKGTARGGLIPWGTGEAFSQRIKWQCNRSSNYIKYGDWR